MVVMQYWKRRCGGGRTSGSRRCDPSPRRGEPLISLEGRVTAYTVAPIWRAALDTLSRNPDRPVIVDASRLEYIDDTGIALIFDLKRRERSAGAQVEIRNLAPNLAALIPDYERKDFVQAYRPPERLGIIEHVGRAAVLQAAYVKRMMRFLRSCAAALGRGLSRRGIIRWGEVVSVATEAGANAVSSYHISPDGSLKIISASVPNGQAATCWIVVNRRGDIITTNPGIIF